jgi:hypothetical protein
MFFGNFMINPLILYKKFENYDDITKLGFFILENCGYES